jgi:Na+-driven multidrug efflux pump
MLMNSVYNIIDQIFIGGASAIRQRCYDGEFPIVTLFFAFASMISGAAPLLSRSS